MDMIIIIVMDVRGAEVLALWFWIAYLCMQIAIMYR